jgi:uncharacterized protein YneF (UPF0154 family)
MIVLVLIASLAGGYFLHRVTWQRTVARGRPWSRIACYVAGTLALGALSIPAAALTVTAWALLAIQVGIVGAFGGGVMLGYLADRQNGQAQRLAELETRLEEVKRMIAHPLRRRHGHAR